jgi:hypothetical protein
MDDDDDDDDLFGWSCLHLHYTYVITKVRKRTRAGPNFQKSLVYVILTGPNSQKSHCVIPKIKNTEF